MRHALTVVVSIGVLSWCFATAFAFAFELWLGASPRTVIVRDTIRGNTHELSGAVELPSRCHTLDARIRELGAERYALDLTTWADPNVACGGAAAVHSFTAVVFSDAARIRLDAALDGTPLRTELLRRTER